MKKLVLALLASTCTIAAFADTITEQSTQAPMVTSTPAPQTTAVQHTTTPAQKPVQKKKPTHPAFNRHDIVCGDKILGENENADSLSDKCKNYKYKHDTATFIEGHSTEHVMCKIKHGQIELSTCSPIKKK